MLSPRDARIVPWRNGRGVTRELALWPQDASFEALDFDWRISTAGVDADGPFSTFPGFERVLVVTDGAGLELDHGDAAPRGFARLLEPYRFDGAWPTSARLARGPVRDFNVLLRRGAAQAELEVLRLGARRAVSACAGDHALVHALEGAVRVRVPDEEEPFEVARGGSVWIHRPAPGDEVEIEGLGRSVAIAVHVRDMRAPGPDAEP